MIHTLPEGRRSTPERKTTRRPERTPLAKANERSTELSRLKSSVLVEFLAGPANARTTVIVEACRPPMSSSVVRTMKQLGVAGIPNAKRPRHAEATVVKPQTGALKAQLEHLGLASTARPLTASGAFVVQVSPVELRQLAVAPSVQAIRPNRTLRR